MIGFCYVSFVDSLAGVLRFADAACYVCYQGVPCYLDQDADPRQHVGGLDKYIYCSNLVLSTSLRSWQAFRLIFSDPSQSSSRLGDYVCTHHLAMTVLFF